MRTWTVPAVVQRVVDGDTLIVDLDLGWNLWHLGQRVRLAGVNCPELSTTEGRAAKTFVDVLLWPGVEVTIVSKGLDKYGRTLGQVVLPSGIPLADALLSAGHATAMK